MSALPSRLTGMLLDFLQTAFRLAPWPTEAGLRRSGNPGRESPVLVTCNYDLTVRRLLRALQGVDAWIVVAPSQGINVWCAASGGHFSTHQVVTALKTCGIEGQVSHRRAILPQLAATGVVAREVSRRCGWHVRFGPVDARDLPRFLAQRQKKSEDMRRVRFSVRERLEMAAAWGIPTALVIGAVGSLLGSAWSLPLVGLCLVQSAAVFLFYDRLPEPRRFVFGGTALALVLGVVAGIGGGASALLVAGGTSVFLSALLTFDYSGSTPIEGGSHFQERNWHVTLDYERCRGVYSCWEVCPEACFEKLEEERKTQILYEDRCVRCGACIVQCPMDALYFEDEAGERIEPDTIRRYKLNLLGRRRVDAGARD